MIGGFTDAELDKRWSGLTVTKRATLLGELGVGEIDKGYLEEKTLNEILRSNQGDIPAIIRGRLIMSMTEDGFSQEKYQEMCKIFQRSENSSELFRSGFPLERGD
jgi:hypothetical protein